MLLLFTIPGCSKCKMVRDMLDKNNIEYKEVNVVESKENATLAQNLGITTGGTLYSEKQQKIVELKDIKLSDIIGGND